MCEIMQCPCGCGQPARESQDERFEGWYSVERQVCYARAALDQFDKGRKPEAGEIRWATRDLPWGRRP